MVWWNEIISAPLALGGPGGTADAVSDVDGAITSARGSEGFCRSDRSHDRTE
jgi:hypothetical protein